ncbi:MAG TPA: tRNA (adenosine(37)-N6)-threonylcarbamoyltransferase complex dimerization subunit type 1 TsaB [Firmicutes bacterium]|nr:tRNA (adenosine(37)-N6)-threonylcarbamoyltransferase complex dimerization subunit type 1 TsaB [Bacillota bacterium]
MNRIYIDTCTPAFLLAVSNGKETQVKKERGKKKAAEVLFPYLKDLLDNLNLTLSEIDEIYVTCGPGSYTGVRISLTFAKVMKVINEKIKVYTIPSLTALLSGAKEKSISLIDARNSAFFALTFDGTNYSEFQRMELSSVKEYINQGYKPVIYEDDEESLNKLSGYDVIKVDVLKAMLSANNYNEVKDYNDIKPIYLKGEGR